MGKEWFLFLYFYRMENEILFSEKQKFNQWWLWVILLAINGVTFLGVYNQLITGQPFGDKPMSNTGLLFTAALILVITILVLNMRLDTLIKKDGIYVKFFPFHWSFKKFSWEQISLCYIRKYSAITEYGGWGIRLGLFGKGKAWNVSGDKGLQLEFTNKKKLLIGTNQPEALAATLEKIGQLKQ
jgi:Family of unknown function (DUF6141)